jgi:hypothetical protein
MRAVDRANVLPLRKRWLQFFRANPDIIGRVKKGKI